MNTSPEPSIRLLMFAYHFPPENAVGGARPYRFFRYLPGFGVSPEVITAAPQEGNHPPGVHYVEDETRPYWEANKQGPLPLAGQLERIARKFFLPGGSGLAWSWKAARLGGQLFDRKIAAQRTAVFSTFPPASAHLAAMQLVNRRDVRWIADFRDPMSLDQGREPGQMWRTGIMWHKTLAVLQQRILRKADLIIVNTSSSGDAFREAFPFAASKIRVLANGYDPEDAIPALPLPARNHRLLVHAGALYAGRNPNLLLQSLSRLKERAGSPASDVRVLLVGPGGFDSGLDTALVERATAEGWVEFIPRMIPPAEARRLCQEADGLVLLQPHSTLQIPGKLFEYVQIGRPILAVAPRQSPVETTLEQAGIPHYVLHPDEDASSVDRKVAAFLELPSTPSAASPPYLERFNAINQTQSLCEMIAGLY